MAVQMVFLIIFLPSTLEPFAQAAKLAKSSCQDRCGNVSIPYPFGMGAAHCYLDESFAIDCNVTEPSGSRKPFWRSWPYLEVLEIQLDGTGLVKIPIFNFGNITDECSHYGCPRNTFHGLPDQKQIRCRGKSVRSAFLVDTEWFKENFRMPIPDNYTVAVAIQWQINSSLFNSLGLSGNAEGSSTSPTYHCSNQTAFGNNRSLAFICSCNPAMKEIPIFLKDVKSRLR
ncbi:putative wall-associated receptor kinase-like 13 [Morella rubra]|uniref:Putative wall-associated receptor kinase-like 13 n=1 Tax=Morella rubra TaxID=262757 RepID=A0A6A1UHQ8_9ROSI|nr:putative wall-associated receptor kinase-like 13 [Morella rubra]